MNHPTPEAWLLYLEGDSPAETTRHLSEHLQSCPQCAAELEGWRRTIGKLEHLPSPALPRATPPQPAGAWWSGVKLSWGLAAMFVLLLGFAAGRLSSRADSRALKTELAAQLRGELRQEVRAELLAALNPASASKTGTPPPFQTDLTNALAHLFSTLRPPEPSLQEFMKTTQQQRDSDRRQLLALIQEVRNLQVADCLSLREDLETAVSVADNDLRQNNRRLNQLADTLLAKETVHN